jgi:hypothetical protein
MECKALDPNLASRYRAYFELMAKNAVMIFYDGAGLVRAETKIHDVYQPPTKENYSNGASNYYLDDPYEGEMFIWFLDLYGMLQISPKLATLC